MSLYVARVCRQILKESYISIGFQRLDLRVSRRSKIVGNCRRGVVRPISRRGNAGKTFLEEKAGRSKISSETCQREEGGVLG